jgi:hypothetical protein
MQLLLYRLAMRQRPNHGAMARAGIPSCFVKIGVALALTLAVDFHPGVVIAQTRDNSHRATVRGGNSQPGDGQLATSALSKFEARRIRHRCLDESASKKEPLLRHCFEMHVAARRLWGECKRKPQMASFSGKEKEEAIRRCVLERLGGGKRGPQNQ